MIKFLDLQKINALHKNELKAVTNSIIESGWYLLGEKVGDFENEISQYTGSPNVVACANGLDALRLILRAYKEMGYMSDGDEIIVPANTYIATILAITDNNLKPIFVEPDVNTYNLNLNKIEDYITEKTKAILIVHLYGLICWSTELEKIAQKNNLIIIEDNAQAIGARWIDGRMSGNLGDASGFSFYPGKNLGALGDSGAVASKNAEHANIIRHLANYGSSKKYVNEYRGFNSRMDEIQAALLCVKLRYLDAENNIRREIAKFYLKKIKNPKIMLPHVQPGYDKSHVWHLFVIRCKERNNLQSFLSDNEIQTLIHYPIPPHLQNCYSQYRNLSLPITENLANEVLSLPISPVLQKYEMERVVSVINEF